MVRVLVLVALCLLVKKVADLASPQFFEHSLSFFLTLLPFPALSFVLLFVEKVFFRKQHASEIKRGGK